MTANKPERTIRISSLVWLLWFTLLALNLADIITTDIAFSVGLGEANPIFANASIGQIAAAKIAVIAAIAAFLFFKMEKLSNLRVTFMIGFANLVYAIVVGINIGAILVVS